MPCASIIVLENVRRNCASSGDWPHPEPRAWTKGGTALYRRDAESAEWALFFLVLAMPVVYRLMASNQREAQQWARWLQEWAARHRGTGKQQ